MIPRVTHTACRLAIEMLFVVTHARNYFHYCHCCVTQPPTIRSSTLPARAPGARLHAYRMWHTHASNFVQTTTPPCIHMNPNIQTHVAHLQDGSHSCPFTNVWAIASSLCPGHVKQQLQECCGGERKKAPAVERGRRCHQLVEEGFGFQITWWVHHALNGLFVCNGCKVC